MEQKLDRHCSHDRSIDEATGGSLLYDDPRGEDKGFDKLF